LYSAHLIVSLQSRNKKKDMSNKERAEKWLDLVAEDLSVAQDLYKTGHWLYTGFMCHQVIEKTLKCYWCVCRDDDPPFLHDHDRIAKGCGLYTKMNEEQKDFLKSIRDLYIEARYREVKDTIARRLTRETTAEILDQTKQLYAWIQERIKEKSLTQ